MQLKFFSEKFQGLRYISPTKDTVVFTRIASANLNSKNINEYAGKYYSTEAEAKYVIAVKEGKLYLHQGLSVDRLLTPTYKDGFLAGGTICTLREIRKTGFRICV